MSFLSEWHVCGSNIYNEGSFTYVCLLIGHAGVQLKYIYNDASFAGDILDSIQFIAYINGRVMSLQLYLLRCLLVL